MALSYPSVLEIVYRLLGLRLVQVIFPEQDGAVDVGQRIVEIELLFQLRHAALNRPVRLFFDGSPTL
jgi:hypothetical protein